MTLIFLYASAGNRLDKSISRFPVAVLELVKTKWIDLLVAFEMRLRVIRSWVGRKYLDSFDENLEQCS